MSERVERPSVAITAGAAMRAYLIETERGRGYVQDICSGAITDGSRLGDPDATNLYTAIASLMGSAYYVGGRARDLIESAAAALPLDLAVRPADLPAAAGFVWLSRPIRTRSTQLAAAVDVRALTWGVTRPPGETNPGEIGRLGNVTLYSASPPPDGATNIVIGCFGTFPESGQPGARVRHDWPPIPLFAASIMPNGSLADLQVDDPDESFLECLRFMIALLSFIQQKIVVAASAPVERAVARAMARQERPIPEVRTIVLRQAERDRRDGAERDAHIEWRYRWLVRGHWRSQWYPAAGLHRTIWILPHQKGPEDRPLKPVASSVFAVVR